MDGFLDYLPAASGLLHRKTWTRRFFRLNAAFHVLEFFCDASMQERKGKLNLQNAQVVTADELGGLLFKGDGEQRKAQLSTKISIENSRRFVIRVSEFDAVKKAFAHHFLCAELADEGAQASRNYMQQWLQALQCVAQSCATKNDKDSAAIVPLGPRELSCKIAAYMDHMHLAACVSGRELENKKSMFEITIKAWILQRELIADDGCDDEGTEEAQSSSSWQILEYACAWKVRKTTAQLRDFDTQLRQFFQRELRDVMFPPSSSSHSLLHSAAHVEAETQRRVVLTNIYLQQLLCLPAFSAFGSDGSVMLDNFLEISPHFASFRQIEKASGQNLQLRKRKVVSWSERLQFEQLYKIHLDAAQAQVDKSQQRRRTSAQSGRRQPSKTDDRRHFQHRHHEHREHRRHHCSSKLDQIPDGEYDAIPGPVATRQPSAVEVPVEPVIVCILERLQGETVQERIAKIGKKLITEAFMSPTLRS